MPGFSLVIPTLRRPDTLAHALSTLLGQTHGDFEIIVQNNGRDPETEAVVRASRDGRVRHFSSDTTLAFTQNWEAALDNARGDFVTFVGDDDGLFPDACAVAAEIFDRNPIDIVSWQPFCYYWPGYLHPELRNRLVAFVDEDFHVQLTSSEEHLRRFYRFAVDYSRLPMIYNSFVGRSVIERAKKTMGQYFLGLAPDLTSGIVNAAHTAQFGVVSRALSIAGLSHHSTGHSTFLSPRGYASRQRIDRDLGSLRMDGRLVPLDNLQVFIASEMLLVGDRMLGNVPGIAFNYRGLIESMAAAINDRPDFYQDTLAAIHSLAARYGVDLDEIAIPPRMTERPGRLAPGTTRVTSHQTLHVLDGDRLGLNTIADAVEVAWPLVPHAREGRPIRVRPAASSSPPRVRRGEAIQFGIGGRGVPALMDGWGDPEEWGAWSIAKRASLRLTVEADRTAPLRAELKFRPFLPAGHPPLHIVCRSRGRDLARWICSEGDAGQVRRISIPIEVVAAGGTVDLEFLVSDPRSPAELGLSSDTRRLGVGMEWLRLLPARPTARDAWSVAGKGLNWFTRRVRTIFE